MTSASMVASGTQGPQATFAYDATARLTGITRKVASNGASISSVFSYDNADRLTTITHSSSSAGALATFSYSYDGASQITQYTGPEGTLTYTYDQSGELVGVGNARSESYSYDLNGNRNMTGWTTGTNNELTADGTNTYAYDNEGNLLSQTRLSDGQATAYTWDYRNRMTQVVVKTSAGVTVTNDVFTYDVENRRIGESITGTQTWFVYDGQNSLEDFTGSGSLTMRYLTGKGMDQLYARYDGTNAVFYLGDNIGSVRLLVNVSGTVLDQLTYNSYGNILTETNSANGDRFKYTSREWNNEIGLQNNRMRYYTPADGRWINQDPIAFAAGDSNLLRYAHNAPILHNDPSGLLQPLGLHLFSSALLGAIPPYNDVSNNPKLIWDDAPAWTPGVDVHTQTNNSPLLASIGVTSYQGAFTTGDINVYITNVRKGWWILTVTSSVTLFSDNNTPFPEATWQQPLAKPPENPRRRTEIFESNGPQALKLLDDFYWKMGAGPGTQAAGGTLVVVCTPLTPATFPHFGGF
jgi:RHS repeat-associated protein